MRLLEHSPVGSSSGATISAHWHRISGKRAPGSSGDSLCRVRKCPFNRTFHMYFTTRKVPTSHWQKPCLPTDFDWNFFGRKYKTHMIGDWLTLQKARITWSQEESTIRVGEGEGVFKKGRQWHTLTVGALIFGCSRGQNMAEFVAQTDLKMSS